MRSYRISNPALSLSLSLGIHTRQAQKKLSCKQSFLSSQFSLRPVSSLSLSLGHLSNTKNTNNNTDNNTPFSCRFFFCTLNNTIAKLFFGKLLGTTTTFRRQTNDSSIQQQGATDDVINDKTLTSLFLQTTEQRKKREERRRD